MARHHSSHAHHHSKHVHNVHHSKHLGEEHYADHDERRREENIDFHMLEHDRSSIANMPQEVKYHEYPLIHEYSPEDLDDTMHGIDAQVAHDESQKMHHFKPKKV